MEAVLTCIQGSFRLLAEIPGEKCGLTVELVHKMMDFFNGLLRM